MVAELADMAMELSRLAYRQAKAEAEAADGGAGAGEGGDAAAAAASGAGACGAGAGDGGAAVGRGAGDADAAAIAGLKSALSGALAAATGEAGTAAITPPRGGAALVFARLSRVAFQALALEERLAEALAAEAAQAAAAAAPAYDLQMTPERKAKIQARWDLLLERKNMVVDVLHDALVTQRPEVNAGFLARALNDRLLEFERFEMLNFTIRENAERLCAMLDLTLDWDRWKDEDWAIAEADGELEWMVGSGPGP
jgi:hypothetical protein